MGKTKRKLNPDYHYRGKVTYIVDGDTVDLDIDLGLYVQVRDQRVRLLGIDTPEPRGAEKEEGLKAKAFLEEEACLSHPDTEIIIETHKDKQGKYGRWLVTLWYKRPDKKTWVNLNEELVERGLAKRL